jgi:hypothetical protein
MSKPGSESSRRWHPQQEELTLELLSKAEFRPIGGKGDGVIERKDHARWAPLLSVFSEGVAQFNANLTTSAKKNHNHNCLIYYPILGSTGGREANGAHTQR